MPRRALTLMIPLALGLGALAFAQPAQARTPPELAPGTKPQNFDFGPAFSVGFAGGPLGGIWLDYLYHFRGDQEGPAIGAMATLSAWPGRFGVASGFMFEYDFRLVPSKNLGLYLGPHFVAGFTAGRWRGNGYGAFYGMGGPTLKLSLNDFWSFWLRPINIEIIGGSLPGDNFYAGWGGALGAGITF